MYKSKLNREYGSAYGCAKCLDNAYWNECEENHLPQSHKKVSQPTEKPMDWEKEFDKRSLGWGSSEDIKSYIKDLLKEERKEGLSEHITLSKDLVLAEYKQKLIKRIKKLRKEDGDYHSALDNILDIINNL